VSPGDYSTVEQEIHVKLPVSPGDYSAVEQEINV